MPDSYSGDDFCDGQSSKHKEAAPQPSGSKRSQAGSQSDAIPPNITSRCSVRHVVSVIDGFSEYKQWLVKEICFGGML